VLTKRAFLCTAAAAGAGAVSGVASAQTYPSKPIRIVVGFAPGGPADVMARLIGQRMTAVLGQSIVIDNRPGAGGTIGARAVAESDPDGYTLLLGNTSTLVISPLIYKNVGYDAVRGFVPIALLGTTSNLLIVNPVLPVKSVRGLISLARSSPGKLNYSSAGIGTPPHLIGEMFKQRLGLDVVHVPYKGGGPSVAAVVAGETQFSFENPASALPLVQAGNVRALASTSETRGSQTPDLPTMIEAGVADFMSVSHGGGGACRHTCRDRRQTQCRHQRKPAIAGGRRHAHEAQRRCQAFLAGRVCGLPCPGAGQVDHGREHRGGAGGVRTDQRGPWSGSGNSSRYLR
jgi:tripartite-type tricarboxylate transporter receptor subunit TctC